MSSESSKLIKINKKLNSEIEKITNMQTAMEEWANKERMAIDQKRIEKLRSGLISSSELNDLIDLISNYSSINTAQKQFVLETLSHLSNV